MLKIGVVGAGNPGKIHIRLLQEIPAFELIGFYDPNPELAEKMAAELNVKAWTSADELIAAADVIDIVTPVIHHFGHAEKAIRKSKHVFIEKPLTHTLNEAKTLVRLASEANVNVQVGHMERFNPAFIAAREFLQKPHLIEAERQVRFDTAGTEISVILDLMIHDIDIVLSLVKANIRRISASGVAVTGETPDIVNARIEFDNGAAASLSASRIGENTIHRTKFFRRDNYVTIDFDQKMVSLFQTRNTHTDGESSLVTHKDNELKSLKDISVENFKADDSNTVRMELESFADSILNNTRPLVTIDDGLKALDVAHKIAEQLQMNINFAGATQ